MIRIGRTLLTAITGITLIIGGCASPQTGTDDPGSTPAVAESPVVQEMKWNMGSEPKTLSPQLNTALDAGNVINNVFSGLVREKDGQMIPEIAEKYEMSEDQLTYTFYLKDSKWSDGKPLTARDFEYAWKWVLNPANGAEYAFQLFYIKGGQDYYEGKAGADAVAVKAINDRILQVTLIAPTSYFLELTAFPTYFPLREDVATRSPNGGWAKSPEGYVSNGPFILKSYQPGTGMILSPNPEYVDADKVSLKKIEILFDSDADQALVNFEEGALDLADSVPVTQISQLEAENESFYIFPNIGTHFYYLNVNEPALQDIRVRKALNLALDRTAIVTQVTKAGQIPATGIVPTGIRDSEGRMFREAAGDYDIPKEYASVDDARALMKEAGYPNGQGFPELEIRVDDSNEYEAIAYFVAASWEETLGITCKVTTYPWAVLQDLRNKGDYMVARGGWIGDYSDPMTFLDLFLSYSGNNDAHWGNPLYDNLIEEAKLLSGPERSKRLYAAERILAESQVVIPLYYLTDPALVSKGLRGWERTGMGFWYFGRTEKIKPGSN